MVDTVPALDKVSFCNSGTEAVYQAVRIVRAVTGKKRIGKFGGLPRGDERGSGELQI